MQSRIDIARVSPAATRAMLGLQEYVNSRLDHGLLELVKMRASQINGCAYCIDMHGKNALADGESAQRLLLLDAWREAPFYSERERAALEWTESLTLVHQGHVPDEVYARAREHFSEQDLVDLALAVVAINGWNRLMVAFRGQAGTYQPAARTVPVEEPAW